MSVVIGNCRSVVDGKQLAQDFQLKMNGDNHTDNVSPCNLYNPFFFFFFSQIKLNGGWLCTVYQSNSDSSVVNVKWWNTIQHPKRIAIEVNIITLMSKMTTLSKLTIENNSQGLLDYLFTYFYVF